MAGQYLATVTNNEEVGPEIYRLSVRAPEIAAHGKPGQFVMLRSGQGLDPLLSRPFSLHRVADDGCFQVLFKVLGKGTRRLAELPVGAPIGVVGPLGRGFDLAKLPTPPEVTDHGAHGVSDHRVPQVVASETAKRTSVREPARSPQDAVPCDRLPGELGLVGGGLGMAPLLFLAQELQRQAPALNLRVLLGARSRRELEAVLADFHSLGLEPGLATDDGSMGHQGLVPELLSNWAAESTMIGQVYCCGPWPMMAAVAEQCRQNSWPCQVSLETMMACGFSACLGCAVKKPGPEQGYWHVCKDGPVFDARDITWG